MNIEPNAGLALAFLIMIGGPVVGHCVKDYFDKLALSALGFGDAGTALMHEDNGVAAVAVGYFVGGMMAMALLMSPFVGASL